MNIKILPFVQLFSLNLFIVYMVCVCSSVNSKLLGNSVSERRNVDYNWILDSNVPIAKLLTFFFFFCLLNVQRRIYKRHTNHLEKNPISFHLSVCSLWTKPDNCWRRYGITWTKFSPLPNSSYVDAILLTLSLMYAFSLL